MLSTLPLCLVTQAGPILWDPIDCSPPGSYVRGIIQARIMEWVAIPFSRSSSWPKDQILISCTAGLFFIVWATREAHHFLQKKKKKLFSKHWILTSKLDQIHGVGWALEVTSWNRCNFTINNIRNGIILEISNISGQKCKSLSVTISVSDSLAAQNLIIQGWLGGRTVNTKTILYLCPI